MPEKSPAELSAEIDKLRAENDALKQAAAAGDPPEVQAKIAAGLSPDQARRVWRDQQEADAARAAAAKAATKTKAETKAAK